MSNKRTYYTAEFTNNNLDPSAIIIDESRTSILIENPTGYLVSVDRFIIDTLERPAFTAKPFDGLAPAATVDVLNYYVQFTWNNLTVTRQLNMVTAYPAKYKPAFVSPLNDTTNEAYYWITSIVQWLGMVNQALFDCYGNAADPTSLLGLPAYPDAQVSAPFIEVNTDTGILALVYPQTFLANGVTITFENELMDILNLPFHNLIQNNAGFPTPNTAYQIDCTKTNQFTTRASRDFLSTSLYAAQMGGTAQWAKPAFYILTAHNYLFTWYDIFEILIISDLAASEALSTSTSRASVQGLSDNVLTSFSVDLNASDVVKGQFVYTPNFRKWLTLNTKAPVNRIHIEFKVVNRLGKSVPLLQTYGRSANVRLLFQKFEDERGFLLEDDEEPPRNPMKRKKL